MVQENSQRSCTRNLRDGLRAAEGQAVAIRKLISRLRSGSRGKGREDMDDAVRLTETIEQLAHFGQNRTAEEAVEIASQVEVLTSLLRAEVDGFFAS